MVTREEEVWAFLEKVLQQRKDIVQGITNIQVVHFGSSRSQYTPFCCCVQPLNYPWRLDVYS